MKARGSRWSFAGATCRRKWAALWLAAGSAALLLDAAPAPGATYHFAAVWDGATLRNNACVTVEGDRIAAVGPCGSGAAVDLTRFTAIPGMIDVHTHMTYVL